MTKSVATESTENDGKNEDEAADITPLSVVKLILTQLEAKMYDIAATGNKADMGYGVVKPTPMASRKKLKLTADEASRMITFNFCGLLPMLPAVGAIKVVL